MNKKAISIIFIVAMMHFLCACGRTESAESSHTGSELIQDEPSQSESFQNEMFCEIPDWLAAYVDYLEGMETYESYYKCSFLYVDEDDIPEFVINTNIYETACIVLTFHDGEVDALQTGGLRLRYIEKQNLLCDTSGQAGEYADQVYSIENGKWTYVAGGKYVSEFKDGLYVDRFSFEWEGETVEEELYWERLHHVFDEGRAIVPKNYIWWDNMMSYIEAGDFTWVWTAEQDTEEDSGKVIADFKYSDEYIPISKIDFASYKNEMSEEDWQALSSFFPILLEGKTFMGQFSPSSNEYTDDFKEYNINNLYACWIDEYPDEFILYQFALCDLTGDGQKELVVYCNFAIDQYCIFHKEGDDFYAVCMHVRWFEDLQKNGIYAGSGGAATRYFHRLHFLRDAFWVEEIAMYDWGYCEIGGEEVSEAEIAAWEDEMMTGEAVWYDARADWKLNIIGRTQEETNLIKEILFKHEEEFETFLMEDWEDPHIQRWVGVYGYDFTEDGEEEIIVSKCDVLVSMNVAYNYVYDREGNRLLEFVGDPVSIKIINEWEGSGTFLLYDSSAHAADRSAGIYTEIRWENGVLNEQVKLIEYDTRDGASQNAGKEEGYFIINDIAKEEEAKLLEGTKGIYDLTKTKGFVRKDENLDEYKQLFGMAETEEFSLIGDILYWESAGFVWLE